MTPKSPPSAPIVPDNDLSAMAQEALPPEMDTNELGCSYRVRVPTTRPVAPLPKYLDSPVEWVDRPTIQNQIQTKGAWKLDKVGVQIFDLSSAESLNKYNEFLAEVNRPDYNIGILKEDWQFSPKTDNWKVLIKFQTVKFKKLIKGDRQSSLSAADLPAGP